MVMKYIKRILFGVLVFIIFNFFLLCTRASLFSPYYAVFYENLEFPYFAFNGWTIQDELEFMRTHTYSNSEKREQRNEEIVNKYLLHGVLCRVRIMAKYETTTSSKNPYRIMLFIYGLPDKHISFTVKQIKVSQPSGNDLSHLADIVLPATVVLEDEGYSSVYGLYSTEEVFKFKKEPVILTFSLEINGVDGPKSGEVTFELSPVVKSGLLRMVF
jgi:hypothetical protein